MYTKKFFAGTDDLADAFFIRDEVFVKEQNFSREIEFDDIDANAFHVVFYDNSAPVATGRMFISPENPNEYVFGRIACLKSYRGKGLGRDILAALENLAKEHNAESVRLGAQVQAQKFYEKYGYSPFGEIYLEEDCPHTNMRKYLK